MFIRSWRDRAMLLLSLVLCALPAHLALAGSSPGRFVLEVEVERAGRRALAISGLTVAINGDVLVDQRDVAPGVGPVTRSVSLERDNELEIRFLAHRPAGVRVSVLDTTTSPPTPVFGPERFRHRPATRTRFARRFASAHAVEWMADFAAPAPERPNIVLVIGDDHAWSHAGFMGHPLVLTPALDSLAESGTTFTNAQLPDSVCRPTLITVLSGLHPERWRDKSARALPIQPARQEVVHFRTLPRELARQGYVSWQGGKMWEGTFDQAGFSDGMARTIEDSIDGWDLARRDWEPSRCGPTRTSDEPCPALAPVEAFLDEVEGQPFLLWFAPTLPHVPFDPPLAYRLPYIGRGLTPREVTYLAQTSRLDAAVGELLRVLDERGLREDTLVVYLSDNGWDVRQSTVDLRRPEQGKASLHELGTRTPIVFSWPGRIPAGRTRDELVAVQDLFPTLLEYAGAEAVPDRRGVSLRRGIESDVPLGRRQVVSFQRSGGGDRNRGYFVRTPRWRYTLALDGHETLHRIDIDPFQEVELASARPAILPVFRDAVLQWEAEQLEVPERLELTGRIRDVLGEPAAGVSVTVLADDVQLRVRTDARGGFRFQHLPHGAVVVERGREIVHLFGPREVNLPVAGLGGHLEELRALMRPGYAVPGASRIRGRVHASLGADDIVVTLRAAGSPAHLGAVVLAGSDGRYLIENLPSGLYEVEASQADRTSGVVRCRLDDDESRCDLELQPGA